MKGTLDTVINHAYSRVLDNSNYGLKATTEAEDKKIFDRVLNKNGVTANRIAKYLNPDTYLGKTYGLSATSIRLLHKYGHIG